MTQVYVYHKIRNFPHLEIGETWQSVTQLGFGGEYGDDSEYTQIRFVGESDHPDFYKFFVKHETTLNRKVRVYNEERNSIIGIEEFHLYIPKNYSYIYADSKYAICSEMLQRIRTKEPNFDYSIRNVELQRLKEESQLFIRGGWFSMLKIANVSAAAIFGNAVENSVDWQRYEDNGTITALNLEFHMNGTGLSVQVTRTGTIVLYQKIKERDSLEFIERINDVVSHFTNEEFLSTKTRKGPKTKV